MDLLHVSSQFWEGLRTKDQSLPLFHKIPVSDLIKTMTSPSFKKRCELCQEVDTLLPYTICYIHPPRNECIHQWTNAVQKIQ